MCRKVVHASDIEHVLGLVGATQSSQHVSEPLISDHVDFSFVFALILAFMLWDRAGIWFATR